MAKEFEFDFKIGGALASSFATAMNAAKGMMKGVSADLQKQNSQQVAKQKELEASMKSLKAEQTQLNAAYKAGGISAAQYASGMQRITNDLKTAESQERKLSSEMKKTSSAMQAQKAASAGAFNVNPINNMTGAVTGLTGKFSALNAKVVAFAGMAATGFGLANVIGSAVNAGESVYQLSTKLHMTAGEASLMSKVLSLTGGDVDTAAKALSRMDKAVIDTGKSGEAMRATLASWGVSLTDANGKLLPMNKQLANMAAGYKKAAAEGKEQEFVLQTLGTKGLELTKTLQNYDEAAETASKVKGVGLDPQAMHKLKLEMDVMKMQAGQFGLAMAQAFAPIAQQVFPVILPQMQALAQWIAKNKETIATFVIEGAKIAAIAVGVSKVVAVGKTLYSGLMMVKNGATIARVALALMGGPVTLAIAAITAGLYLLYNHWDEVTQFMSNSWKAVCTMATNVWNGFKTVLSMGINALKFLIVSYINFWLKLPSRILWVIGFIAGAVPRIPSIIGNAIMTAGSFLARLPAMCIQAGTAFLSAAGAWLSSAYSITVDWISNTVSSAGTTLLNLPQICAEAGAAFVSSASSWASEAYNAVLEWIQQIPSMISNYVSSAWNSAKASLQAGFGAGSGSNSESANAIGGIYGQGAFHTTFAENSPEAAIPIDGSSRSMDLWRQTGHMLGVDNMGGGINVNLTVPVTVNGAMDNTTAGSLGNNIQAAVERAMANVAERQRRLSYV